MFEYDMCIFEIVVIRGCADLFVFVGAVENIAKIFTMGRCRSHDLYFVLGLFSLTLLLSPVIVHLDA